MGRRTDTNDTLHAISVQEWESQRIRNVDGLAAALGRTVDAARAVPDYTRAGKVDLARVADELRTELRAQLTATSPFTKKARSQRAVAQLQALARECGYDPQGDSPLDALIAYKDALEERLLCRETGGR